MKKKCSRCNKLKNIDNFYKSKSIKDGFRSRCKKCDIEVAIVSSKNNRDKVNKRVKEYRKNNPDKFKEYDKKKYEKYKIWKKNNPKEAYKKNRERMIKLKYGITLVEYDTMLKKQDHKCFICKTHQERLSRGLLIDHCHRTNVVRGLLCDNCNKALGLFNDNIEILKKAIKYLKKYEK